MSALLLPLLLSAVPVSHWEYRWGEAAPWEPITLPAHPPSAGTDLYERAQLPPGEWKDAALQLDAVIGHFELFADGAPIYVHPPEGIDAKGIAGVPFHLISLPPGTREVMLHVRTSYPLAGIQAVPTLGERSELITAIVRNDTPRLVAGLLMVLLGVLGLVVTVPARAAKLGVGFALYTSASGLFTIYYTHLKQLVLPFTPAVWFVIWLLTLALLPVGYLRFLTTALAQPSRGLLLMRRLHEGFGAFFVLFCAGGFVALSTWGLTAERYASPLLFGLGSVLRLMMLVTAVVSFAHIGRLARAPGPDQTSARLLIAALAVLLVALVANVGAALGLLPTMRGAFATPGLFALAIVFAIIAQRSWAQTKLELADRVKEKEAMLRDLHDGIGGVTTNIRLLAELGSRDAHKAMDALTAIAELSTEGLAELRAFTQTLDEGEAQVTWPILFAELRRFGGQLIESHGKTFNLDAKVEGQSDTRPKSALCLTVLRIFREALTNVVKHAGATRVDVAVHVSPGQLSLSITDDGEGGGKGGGLDTGRGVANMKARAKDLGGELSVVKDAGTRLELKLPLAAQ